MTFNQKSQYKKQDQSHAHPSAPPKIDIQKILKGDDPKLLIDEAKRLADQLIDSRSKDSIEGATTQVRRLFSSFRQIEHSWPADIKDDPEKKKAADEAYFELVLFAPKLQYVASKHGRIEALTDVLEEAIGLVGKDRGKLSVLMNFFEAAVAYYVANQPKTNKDQEIKR